jgi:membrane-associated protein
MNSLVSIIIGAGYAAIALTLFAESGFFLGFFLPGESLLFTVGILASQGLFNIWILIALAIPAAILGDSFGYWTGKYFGQRLFSQPDSIIFKRKYVTRTEAFYQKHGTKTIILARFVPIVRTFAPIMAGLGSMKYIVFLRNNVVGGVFWAGGVLGISYYVGSKIPSIQHYLSYIIIAIIVVSVSPLIFEYIALRKEQERADQP